MLVEDCKWKLMGTAFFFSQVDLSDKEWLDLLMLAGGKPFFGPLKRCRLTVPNKGHFRGLEMEADQGPEAQYTRYWIGMASAPLWRHGWAPGKNHVCTPFCLLIGKSFVL